MKIQALRYADGMKNIFAAVCLLLGLLVFGMCIGAEKEKVYRSTDAEGNVVYSDRPEPGAEEIERVDVQTIEAPKTPPKQRSVEKLVPEYRYTEVAISSPKNDETIWNNAGDLTVTLLLVPNLNAGLGHRVALSMDGAQIGQPGTQLQYQLTGIERGTHVLKAVILDKDGKQLAASGTTTVHLHQASVLNKPKPPPKN